MNLRAAAIVLISATLAGAGCNCGERRGPENPPLTEELLVALAQAKAYHHQADVHLSEGDTEAATHRVEKILLIHFPIGAPEGEEAKLDARARLAKLYLGSGKPEEARRVVNEGLSETKRDSFFLANLHTVSGELYEAQAKRLEGSDPAAARESRRAALAEYDNSIQINERIQKRYYKEARP